MSASDPVTVLRVFTSADGSFGNPLGIVDGALVPPGDRQRVAHVLGYSETVFIDDEETGELRIFTPSAELPLAGHPLVGSAWHLLRRGAQGGGDELTLRPPGGDVRAFADDEARTWIDAPFATLPDWTLVRLEAPEAVDALTGPLRPDHDHVVYFADVDRAGTTLRVRTFAPRFGVAEDEATGSAALRLVQALGRPLEVHQGRGSRLHARPVDGERGCVGGFVVADPSVPLP